MKDTARKSKYVISGVLTKQNANSPTINIVQIMDIYKSTNLSEAKGMAMTEFMQEYPNHQLFGIVHIKLTGKDAQNGKDS